VQAAEDKIIEEAQGNFLKEVPPPPLKNFKEDTKAFAKATTSIPVFGKKYVVSKTLPQEAGPLPHLLHCVRIAPTILCYLSLPLVLAKWRAMH
jgi:hypothetical protein